MSNTIRVLTSKSQFPSSLSGTEMVIAIMDMRFRIYDGANGIIFDSYVDKLSALSWDSTLNTVTVGFGSGPTTMTFDTSSMLGGSLLTNFGIYIDKVKTKVNDDLTTTTEDYNIVAEIIGKCYPRNDWAAYSEDHPDRTPAHYCLSDEYELMQEYRKHFRGEDSARTANDFKQMIDTKGKLERVSDGEMEYPVFNEVYYSPNQLGSARTKRIYFSLSNSTGLDWATTLTAPNNDTVNSIQDFDLQMKVVNETVWRRWATSNSYRYWYVSEVAAKNGVKFDFGRQIVEAKGWIDYI